MTVVPMKSSLGPRLVNRYNRFALGCLLVVYAVAHTPILCCLSRSNESSRCRNRMGGGWKGLKGYVLSQPHCPKNDSYVHMFSIYFIHFILM